MIDGREPRKQNTMNQKEFSTGNCPYCTKIIFKDAVFNSEASFSTRCPHCNKTVKVLIEHKIEITIIAVDIEGKPNKIFPGQQRRR